MRFSPAVQGDGAGPAEPTEQFDDLIEPILEYYERVLTQMDADNDHLMAELPSSLKVQLALTLNADFLKGVSFFRNLEPRIIATLVLCLRSRIYMVSPRELAESHLCTVHA